MKHVKNAGVAEQPVPFTPGINKNMVRQHARRLLEKGLLDHDPLTSEDWVLAERDLIEQLKKHLF